MIGTSLPIKVCMAAVNDISFIIIFSWLQRLGIFRLISGFPFTLDFGGPCYYMWRYPPLSPGKILRLTTWKILSNENQHVCHRRGEAVTYRITVAVSDTPFRIGTSFTANNHKPLESIYLNFSWNVMTLLTTYRENLYFLIEISGWWRGGWVGSALNLLLIPTQNLSVTSDPKHLINSW